LLVRLARQRLLFRRISLNPTPSTRYCITFISTVVSILMPKVVDPRAQRKVIRAAALRVFGQRGIEGVGLAHVARRAGMGRASLYHYYPDKAALVRDLVRDLLSQEERLVDRALENREEGPLERIERMTGEMSDLFKDWASLGPMLLDLWSTDVAMFRAFFRRIRRNLAAAIAQGQQSGAIGRKLDPQLAATMVIAIIDGMLLQRIMDRAALPDAEVTRGLMVAAVRRVLVP
jgi:AcrR family transcriptional regulator